jgi:hypothetical protein
MNSSWEEKKVFKFSFLSFCSRQKLKLKLCECFFHKTLHFLNIAKKKENNKKKFILLVKQITVEVSSESQ